MVEAVGAAAVVCKPGTPLPELPPGVEIWHEGDARHHPAAGLLEALDRADGDRIAVLGADMPFAEAELVRVLLAAGEGSVAARTAGGIQPLAAVYAPSAASTFREALEGERPMRAAVEELGPVLVDVEARLVASINRPEDLA